MTKKNALRLHNGDQVFHKKTNDVLNVIRVKKSQYNPKIIYLEVTSEFNNFMTLTHKEVK